MLLIARAKSNHVGGGGFEEELEPLRRTVRFGFQRAQLVCCCVGLLPGLHNVCKIDGQHQLGLPVAVIQGEGRNPDVNRLAILEGMSPDAGLFVPEGLAAYRFPEFWHVFSGPDVSDGHSQKFILGIAIEVSGSVVDVQKAQTFTIEDQDGFWVVMKKRDREFHDIYWAGAVRQEIRMRPVTSP
nr:hypothetical protein [Henriciella aquimarina]